MSNRKAATRIGVDHGDLPPQKPRKKKRLGDVLIIAGCVLLAAFLLITALDYPWHYLFSKWGIVDLQDELPDPAPLPESAQIPGAVPEDAGDFAFTELPLRRPPMDLQLLGNIKLPRIGVSENIVEGVGLEMLYGVGHVPETALPGQPGNCVLAGHRNYIVMRPFRHMDKLQMDDYIYITYDDTVYTYQVFNMFEIDPDETWVLQVQEEEEYLVTLLTCTPVLTYTHRLIVWGRLVDTHPA